MFQPVKIGVIGLGRFGRLHALTALGLAETQLVAVVARRQVSLERLAPELPGVPGFTDLAQAMSQSGAEAWIVACSTRSHVAVTRALLEAGHPVLLEKPISDSLAEVRSLESLVQSDSRNLMLGHIVLFNSEFQQLRDEVRGRGPIAYLDAIRHRPASIVSQFPGENPLHAAMVHDLYMAQALVGRSDPVHFSAQYHRTASGQIDLALAQMIWPGGTVGSFAASYLTPAGMPPRGIDRLEVFGEGWAARITPNPRPFEMWDERATWPLALEIRTGDSGPTGMMAEEQRCFARIVRGLSPVPPGATYHDALQVQHWMETLTRSAEQSAGIRPASGSSVPMKWFYLTGRDVRVDILLIHELRRQEPVRLARFAGLTRCPECDKFDEEEVLAIGFDPQRKLPMPQDIVTWPLDLPWTLVSDRFRAACVHHEIAGVRFIRCGRTKDGEPIHALWPVHTSPCRAPIEDWLRGFPRKPNDPPDERCGTCGRVVQVVGFPPPAALEFPHDRTMSIPSILTEMRTGRDFRFFCSGTVRQILRQEQLRGLSFSPMDTLVKRFHPPAQ